MKITGIKIDGMHKANLDTHLIAADFTYITGPNGSGKSTILQAIQLALFGFISGTNKTKTAIMSHAANDTISIELRLYGETDTDPDELIVKRMFVNTGKAITEKLTIYPDSYSIEDIISSTYLPFLNFDEFITLSANKQKDQLISMLACDCIDINTKEYFSKLSSYDSASLNILESIISKFSKLTCIEDVKNLNSYLKELQKSINAEEKRLTSTIQSMIYYEDYSGEQDLDVIQNEINNLMNIKNKLNSNEVLDSRLQQLKTKLASYEDIDNIDSKITEFEDKICKYEITLNSTNNEVDEYVSHLNELLSEINFYSKIIKNGDICPLLNTKCSQLDVKLDEIAKNKTELESKISKLSDHIIDLKSKRQELENKINEYNNSIHMLKINKTEILNIKTEIYELTTQIKPIEGNIQEISEKLDKLNQEYIQISANKKYEELIEDLQIQKVNLNLNQQFIKECIKETSENGLQSEIVEKPLQDLQQIMNEILESSKLTDLGSIKFILSSKSNSFDFGFQRKNSFIPFNLLSSGEKCIFMLVFLQTLNMLKTSSICNFILIDDMFDHLDDVNFKKLVSYLDKLIMYSQIIVAGVKHIDNLPTHTNIIDLSKDSV